MWTRDNLTALNVSYLSGFDSACFKRSRHRGNLAFDDDRYQSAAKALFYVNKLYVRRLYHRVKPGDCREVYDHAIAGIMPELENDDDVFPDTRVRVEGVSIKTRLREQGVDEAVVGIEHIVGEHTDDNVGNKVREQHHGLRRALENLAADFGKHDGKHDLKDVAQTDEHEVVQQRVLGNHPQLAGLDQELEVIQADKRTAEDALAEDVDDEEKAIVYRKNSKDKK